MKDNFYKDIKHKRTQDEAEQSKGKAKNKEKKDNVKEDENKTEEQSFKRSAKYKEDAKNATTRFSSKVKEYFNRENLEKGKAFFAGKLSSYNERFSDELKVTREKLDEFRNRPKNQKIAADESRDEQGAGRNKGLVPLIAAGVIIVPLTLFLGFIIISNFWPSNDGMELATDDGGTEETEEAAESEEAAEDEGRDEGLEDQRFEMERRMAESRGTEDDESGESEEEDVEVTEEEDLASENVEAVYSSDELSILEDIAGDAIEEREGGDESAEETSDASGEAEAGQAQDEDASGEDQESVGATHVVGEGDNLYQIARQYYGSGSAENVQRIRDANGVTGNNISLGQELVIP
ncbi:LysM peptidoglycan-binding domain-containing protein [Lacicoccus alkaliphilus]|uniref:LysM domain-containing protein n=1 Tax=Lacicoccus alkaliphilus DSM 16010 TaxID=1123231 RepID=A0A1M7BC85_9BACL|nr:LysM peptidoglycan-binding domain-containing protein [Salinicoccus alkaliphilus]SHL52553.1 LysM domain-containing protein [Salinicoccus alkaliphilus DSM 16010]